MNANVDKKKINPINTPEQAKTAANRIVETAKNEIAENRRTVQDLLEKITEISVLAILWHSAFKWVYLSSSPLLFTSLLFSAICKASSDSHLVIFHFFFLGMVLIPVSCTVSPTSIHSYQALCLSDLGP